MEGSEMVARIAPEVDRLVWAIGPAISAADRARLDDATKAAGLDGTWYLANFVEFFQHGGISIDTALLRQAYASPDHLKGWFADLAQHDLIEEIDGRWTATERAGVLFDTLVDIQGNTTRALWGSHAEVVTEALARASSVVNAASDDHTVAAAHRGTALPDDPTQALLRRLVTLRYLRQHDHMTAWRAEGLTAHEMIVFTELWHGGAVDESPELTSLVERGLATPNQALTDLGHTTRDRIEDETNRLNAEDFAVLGSDGQEQFVTLLQELPSTPSR